MDYTLFSPAVAVVFENESLTFVDALPAWLVTLETVIECTPSETLTRFALNTHLEGICPVIGPVYRETIASESKVVLHFTEALSNDGFKPSAVVELIVIRFCTLLQFISCEKCSSIGTVSCSLLEVSDKIR